MHSLTGCIRPIWNRPKITFHLKCFWKKDDELMVLSQCSVVYSGRTEAKNVKFKRNTRLNFTSHSLFLAKLHRHFLKLLLSMFWLLLMQPFARVGYLIDHVFVCFISVVVAQSKLKNYVNNTSWFVRTARDYWILGFYKRDWPFSHYS